MQNLKKFNNELGNALAIHELDQQLILKLHQENFSGIVVYNPEGKVITRVGQFSEANNAEIPFKSEKSKNYLL